MPHGAVQKLNLAQPVDDIGYCGLRGRVDHTGLKHVLQSVRRIDELAFDQRFISVLGGAVGNVTVFSP